MEPQKSVALNLDCVLLIIKLAECLEILLSWPRGIQILIQRTLFLKKFVTTSWTKLTILHEYMKCVLETFFLEQKLITSDNLTFLDLLFGCPQSTLGHYGGKSFTHSMLITVSYVFSTQRSPGTLGQGLVLKPNRLPSSVVVETLLVLIWSRLNPLGHSLHATSMNNKFIILATSRKF